MTDEVAAMARIVVSGSAILAATIGVIQMALNTIAMLANETEAAKAIRRNVSIFLMKVLVALFVIGGLAFMGWNVWAFVNASGAPTRLEIAGVVWTLINVQCVIAVVLFHAAGLLAHRR